MDSFNNGRKTYINSASFFSDVENDFQRDNECEIYHSKKGHILFPTRKYDLSTDDNIRQLVHDVTKYGIPTKDTRISISGYLCCFFIIHKSEIDVEMLLYKDGAEQTAVVDFLESYGEIVNDFNISIYNADKLLEIFQTKFKKFGYQMQYDKVVYADLTQEQKIDLINQRKYKEIIFTKALKFQSQNEFRIFLVPNSQEYTSHIEVEGIDLRQSLVRSYNSEVRKI